MLVLGWFLRSACAQLMHIVCLCPPAVSAEAEQQHFDAFFEDVFVECEDRYGPIEEMNICDNLGDHLVGNVYIKVTCSLFVFIPTVLDSK